MRTSLPEICLAASMAGLEPQNQPPKTRLAPLPSRSGRHIGAAESVDQTFPRVASL